MSHFLVIAPTDISDSFVRQSKHIVSTLYEKNVEGIYYRVKTKQKLDDPRRLFIRGDGKTIEIDVKPHLSLVHNIHLETNENKKTFNEDVQKVLKEYKPFELKKEEVGDYGKDFTFFVRFSADDYLYDL